MAVTSEFVDFENTLFMHSVGVLLIACKKIFGTLRILYCFNLNLLVYRRMQSVGIYRSFETSVFQTEWNMAENNNIGIVQTHTVCSLQSALKIHPLAGEV